MPEINDLNFFRNAKMSLNFREESEVRKLKNFQKNHRVPFDVSEASAKFIGSLVHEDLEERFTSMHKKLRAAFGLRRKDIQVQIDEFGFAALEMKNLRYVERFEQTPKSPEKMVHEKCLDQISDLNVVTHTDFDSIFGSVFTSLDFVFENILDVEDLIDAFEELDDPRLSLDYNLDATECTLSFPSGNKRLLVTASQIRVVSWLPTTGRQLFKEAVDYQNVLADVFRSADLL